MRVETDSLSSAIDVQIIGIRSTRELLDKLSPLVFRRRAVFSFSARPGCLMPGKAEQPYSVHQSTNRSGSKFFVPGTTA